MRLPIILLLLMIFTPLHSLSAGKSLKQVQKEKVERDFKAIKQDRKRAKELSDLVMKARRMRLEGEGKRLTETKSGDARQVTTTCPVCELTFKAWDVDRQRSEKGIDRDLCKHAQFKSAYDFDLWSCPQCSYTHFKPYFKNPVEDELIEFVQTRGKKLFGELFIKQLQTNIFKMGFTLDQEDIPTIIKYTMMEFFLEKHALPWKYKAKFYLQYAWVERLRMVSPIISPELSVISSTYNTKMRIYARDNDIENIIANPWDVIAFLDKQKESQLNNLEKMMKYVYMAGQVNRLGNIDKAHEYLKKTTKLKLRKEFRDLIRFKHELLKHEVKLLKEAAICIKEAMKRDEFSRDELPQYVYILGELYRRFNMLPESHIWFQLAIEESDDPETLLTRWAKEQVGLMPKAASLPPAADEEIIFVEKVRRKLNEPKVRTRQQIATLKSDPKKVSEWLKVLQQAVGFYYKEFQFDPENLNDIIELDLLKNHPELERVATRFFTLEVHKNVKQPYQRYTITSLLPYQDEKGMYYQSLQGHTESKLRQNNP